MNTPSQKAPKETTDDDILLSRYIRFGLLTLFFGVLITIAYGFLGQYLTNQALQNTVNGMILENMESIVMITLMLILTGNIVRRK